MALLGIVTGLESEAATAGRVVRDMGLGDQVRIRCAGPGIVPASRAAQDLMMLGATVLLSFGLAGALVRNLKPGTLATPRLVVGADGVPVAVEDKLHERLDNILGASRREAGLLISTQTVIADRRAKKRLAEDSRARIVDMESYGVALTAVTGRARFAVLRAIADGFDHAIPSAARAGVAPDGRIRPMAVMTRLAARPWQLGAVIQLGRDNARAMRALSAAARLAFPMLIYGR